MTANETPAAKCAFCRKELTTWYRPYFYCSTVGCVLEKFLAAPKLWARLQPLLSARDTEIERRAFEAGYCLAEHIENPVNMISSVTRQFKKGDKNVSEKTFKIIDGDISDGFHTFDELYEHRCLLFINWMISDGCPGECYWVREHFDGWDLIVCEIAWGMDEQISYHVPVKYRGLYDAILKECPSFEHVFDGHTSKDVALRLLKLAARK